MNSFIRKISLLLALLAITYGWAVYLGKNKAEKVIGREVVYKVNYTFHRLDSLKLVNNKIVMVGGSNNMFGIDPYYLSQMTGRPVINLSHIRTYGIKNMLLLAELTSNPTDIILLSLEYGDWPVTEPGTVLNYYLTHRDLSVIAGNYKYLVNVVADNFSRKSQSNIEKKIYESFDENFFVRDFDTVRFRNGDVTLYDGSGYSFTYDKMIITAVEKFKSRNLHIYAFHPPIIQQKLNRLNKVTIATDGCNLLPLPYITHQQDYVYDTSQIYDFPFHLNGRGRKLRTEKLAADIKRYFQKQ